MRVVHYLNQFFGGLGGEEKAGEPLRMRDGAVGPGKVLEQVLGKDAKIVLTLVCGDNYAVERQDEFIAAALDQIRNARPNLFVAGPCFQAGRYGLAAGALCAEVQAKLSLPVITAMAEENPGADLYREFLYIVNSGTNAAAMGQVLGRMAGLAHKILSKAPIGTPKDEGYLPRGLVRDQFVEQTAAERLVAMVLAKTNGEAFESEMIPAAFAPVPMPPAVRDLSKAKIMLVTDGGLVPRGNPDKIEGSAATRWGSYDISNCDDLDGENYEISHGGYDPQFVRQDPDRLVPLDALRELERQGVIGKIHGEFLTTSGLSNPLSNTRRMGREMAEKARREAVDAVILTST
jgi:glycine reductase